jgi:phosphomannomutase
MAARRKGVCISDLLARLPGRYTHADRKKEFPAEAGRAVIRRFSPAREGNIRQVDFAPDGEASVTYLDGALKEFGPENEFHAIRDELASLFTPRDGFADIIALNYIDGVRISFSNGEISHLRPSGNAPEFRNYAIADSQERAREIVEIGLKKILPAMAKAVGYNLS